MSIGEIISVALFVFTVMTGARVAYGSWFWELSKSWWHTKQEIEKLRSDLEGREKLLDRVRELATLVTKRGPAVDAAVAATLNLPC